MYGWAPRWLQLFFTRWDRVRLDFAGQKVIVCVAASAVFPEAVVPLHLRSLTSSTLEERMHVGLTCPPESNQHVQIVCNRLATAGRNPDSFSSTIAGIALQIVQQFFSKKSDNLTASWGLAS